MCRENSLQWCFGLKLDFVSKKNTPNSQKKIHLILKKELGVLGE